MKHTLAFAALLLSAAAAATQTPLDWTVDPIPQFKAALAGQEAVPTPATALADAADAAPARIAATPVTDNSAFQSNIPTSASVSFTINPDGDRVGAILSLCGGDSGDGPCPTMTFVFPQLTYDRANKLIKLGDEVVEKHGNFVWNQWKNPRYVLSYGKSTKTIDLGFERVTKDVYSVYLERK